MKGKRIYICDREAARRFCPPWPYAVISITDPPPQSCPLALPRSPLRLGVLRLEFHDFNERHITDGFEYEGRPVSEWAMQPWQARKIWDFLNPLLPRVRGLMVHCEAGVSRSPSVAKALCDSLGWPRDNIRSTMPPYMRNEPAINGLVYKRICDATLPF